MAPTYVIIGGDAAGMSAASKARRSMPDAHVIVLERSPHISYSACGMPYWIGGTIESDRKLMILTPERARERRGIDVRTGHEAVSIDTDGQTVEVRELETGRTFSQPYDKLLIATGAKAQRPPIPGLPQEDAPGIFTLRTLQDGQRIFAYLEEHRPQRAVIVGGGYIGVEMAEGLRERGLSVTLVEMLPQLMPQFDPDMVDEITAHLVDQGVDVHTGTRVTSLALEGTETHVALDVVEGVEGKEEIDSDEEVKGVKADLILLATGVEACSELAADAGLRLGASGAIWVDDHMRTSAPGIFAAGDCVEYRHRVLDRDMWVPLAPAANRSGRVAGDNMSGGDATFPGVIGTAIVKVFDYTMAVAGLTQRLAQDAFGADAIGSATVDSYEKAYYWPGAEKIKVKLLFHKTDGRVLGGQVVGRTGVEGRINVIATAIISHLTVADMAMLDLAYAPPYAPTYDPVQVCANVALRDVAR